MEVIITGAAGFIGSNLSMRMLSAGHKVTGIDNLSFGTLKNLDGIFHHRNFIFLNRDLRSSGTFDDIRGDVIFHFASQKIPRYTNALCTLEDNSAMLRNVVNKCIRDKAKLIYASTSDVYGKNPNIPYNEESDLVLGQTTVKRWAYALSKIYGEQYIIANHDEFNLNYTIVRFFGSYGPRQNLTWWGGPQSVFIANALLNKPLEIHGDGLQTRTFTYIDDTVQALEKCVNNSKSNNEIFNIANNPDEEITIMDLGKLIWRLIRGNDTPIIKFVPYQTFGKYEDVRRRVPDISKIKSLLGYNPQYSLSTGLRITIDWQKNLSQ